MDSKGDFPVVVRPIEPELRIIPCCGFIPKQDGTSVDFGTRSIKEAAARSKEQKAKE